MQVLIAVIAILGVPGSLAAFQRANEIIPLLAVAPLGAAALAHYFTKKQRV